jgi:dolichol kinase
VAFLARRPGDNPRTTHRESSFTLVAPGALRFSRRIELALQSGGQALALELHAFLRDADRARKTEFRRTAETRLEAIAATASELLDRAEMAAVKANAVLLDGIESVRSTIGDHLGEGTELRRELDALVGKLRQSYEELAAALRADEVEVPQLRPANYLRNVFHIGWSLFGAALILSLGAWPKALLGVALAFAAAGWTMEIARRRSPAINERLMRAFRHVSHPHEAHQVNSATWYASALVLLALTREPTVMVVGVLVLGFADPAAAIIGRRFGRIKLVNGRTLEGSATFALVGAFAAFGALSVAGGTLLPSYAFSTRLVVALVAGLLGAIAELYSRRVDDNFSIPVTSALGAWAALALMA